MIKDLEAYELISEQRIDEVASDAIYLRHKKTGAKVALLSNKDNNKTFYIGFRTPVKDDTGVPHIVEHTVLCGSEKYNIKDPFMELVKGSLNTFLNAMTYPDKTIYPVASTNDVDFHNLVDVYMDAVFHPNIYKYEEIFKQEGWTYELESVEGEIKYNGVVYNEMKGAFSSPDAVLERVSMKSLYPDTTYAHESGGDPDSIPNLTYEDYLTFHKAYYHPSNSYIYLYGDMDMEKYLKWFDEEYLSKYEYQHVDSEITLQTQFKPMNKTEEKYSITEDESTENKAYFSYNIGLGDSHDVLERKAFGVLKYTLFNMDGAPVKQALYDAKLAEDVYSMATYSLRQPFFSLVAKNAPEDKCEEFVQVIQDTLKKVIEEGIPEDAIRASINSSLFSLREANYGSTPAGLLYGIYMLDSWLYDETDPFSILYYEDAYKFLKEQIGTGYYEKLVQEIFLNNERSSVVAIMPEPGLTVKKDAEVKEKLATYKKSLSAEELEKMVEATLALQEYKNTPDTEEALKCLPMLKLEDLGKEGRKYNTEELDFKGVKVLYNDMPTNKIAYVDMKFEMPEVTEEMLPYVGLLINMLGYFDTENYSYRELSNQIDIHTGGIRFSALPVSKLENPDKFKFYFTVDSSAMYDEVDSIFSLVEEILTKTSFEDEKHLLECILEMKSSGEEYIMSSGHSAAKTRCAGYYNMAERYRDRYKGISFFWFLNDLIKNFDTKKETVKKNLTILMKQIFTTENMLLAVASDRDFCMSLQDKIYNFSGHLNPGTDEKMQMEPLSKYTKNEGFKTSAQIQYVVQTGDYRKAGYKFHGALKVLTAAMRYEYLWNAIRVQGGAYGCSVSIDALGGVSFTTYRDPNLEKSFENFEKSLEWIEQINYSERDLTKYIIGAIGAIDTPTSVANHARRGVALYMMGITNEYRQKEREEVLATTNEDLKAQKDLIKVALDAKNICVIGNEGKIQENEKLFGATYNLMTS